MKEYFTSKEFDSPEATGSGKLMSKDFIKRLSDARHIAGVPFVINSGYRTKSHNELVGGSKTSSHLIGLAVDIRCNSGLDRLTIITALITAGFKRIGVAKTFIHVDSDDSKPNSVWVY